MNRIREVLVPVDGSDTSSRAVDFAIGLATYARASLLFCHAVDTTGVISGCANPYGLLDVAPIVEALRSQCATYLHDAVQRARAAGVEAAGVSLSGAPVGAIVVLLQDRPVDAIVMGSHGKTGMSRFFLGGTADGLVRRAGVPVFVVPPGAKTPCNGGLPIASIEVAFDGSQPAEAAFRLALDLAKPGTTNVYVSYAVDPYLGDGASAQAPIQGAVVRARSAGVAAHAVFSEGAPSRCVLELAQSHGSQLIAIGMHGRRGIDRVQLGSVAEAVLRGASVPVLVVPWPPGNSRAATPARDAVPFEESGEPGEPGTRMRFERGRMRRKSR